MTVDEGLKLLAESGYPGKVDVVDSVMAEVSKHPYLRPVHRPKAWQRIVSTTAAAVIVAVAVNVVTVRMSHYDENGIGSMISQVHNYEYYSPTVEDGAVNPMDYFYNEYEY